MQNNSDSALESRATPVQRRGLARVDALLDAAAEIVEDAGIVGMTTSAIAERSESSVGLVYRYFPNADAVLVALAARNRERFMARLSEAFAADQPAEWTAFATLCVDVYAELSRTVPAFRIVRFGDVVVLRFANRDSTNNVDLARELDDLLVARYAFAPTDELLFATQLAMECADAVTRRAFLHDPDGDERFLRAAKELVVGIIEPHAGAGAVTTAPADGAPSRGIDP